MPLALRLRGVPLVYEINVAEIIHGRTLPFNLKLGMKPGQAKLQITGTLVGLEGTPKVKGKIKGEGASLAKLAQAFGMTVIGLKRDTPPALDPTETLHPPPALTDPCTPPPGATGRAAPHGPPFPGGGDVPGSTPAAPASV